MKKNHIILVTFLFISCVELDRASNSALDNNNNPESKQAIPPGTLKELKDLKGENSSMKSENEANNTIIRELNQSIEELELELENLKSEKDEKKAKSDEIENLKSEIEDLRIENKTKLGEKDSELSNKAKELDDMKKELDKMKNENGIKKTKRGQLEAKLIKSENDLASKTQENQKLIDDLKNKSADTVLNQKLTDLEAQLNDEKLKNNALALEKNSLIIGKEAAENEKKSAEQKAVKAETEKKAAEDAKTKAEADKKIAEDAKNKVEAENATLKIEKQAADAAQKAALAEKTKAETDKKDAEQKLIQALADKQTALAAQSKAETEKKAAEDNLKKVQDELKKVQDEIEKVQDEIEKLKGFGNAMKAMTDRYSNMIYEGIRVKSGQDTKSIMDLGKKIAESIITSEHTNFNKIEDYVSKAIDLIKELYKDGLRTKQIEALLSGKIGKHLGGSNGYVGTYSWTAFLEDKNVKKKIKDLSKESIEWIFGNYETSYHKDHLSDNIKTLSSAINSIKCIDKPNNKLSIKLSEYNIPGPLHSCDIDFFEEIDFKKLLEELDKKNDDESKEWVKKLFHPGPGSSGKEPQLFYATYRDNLTANGVKLDDEKELFWLTAVGKQKLGVKKK